MRVEIETTATIGKGVSIKREKGSDDIEVVVAHLKFDNALVPREVIDELLGQDIGWAQHCLFNELGAPIGHIELSLPRLKLTATGKIRGVDGDAITLTEAAFDSITLTLTDKGALLSGALAWKVAGDEVSYLEPLLGRICVIHWIAQDGGQQDLLRAA